MLHGGSINLRSEGVRKISGGAPEPIKIIIWRVLIVPISSKTIDKIRNIRKPTVANFEKNIVVLGWS
jgi:hypothetical protein